MGNEYRVTQEDLTAIADKIREKAEITSGLVFPNGFIDAIANLGGSSAGIKAMESGVYIPTSDVALESYNAVNISHNLGEIPSLFMFGCFTEDTSASDFALSGWRIVSFTVTSYDKSVGSKASGEFLWVYNVSQNNEPSYSSMQPTYGTYLQADVVKVYGTSYNPVVLKSGRPYQWIAVKYE